MSYSGQSRCKHVSLCVFLCRYIDTVLQPTQRCSLQTVDSHNKCSVTIVMQAAGRHLSRDKQVFRLFFLPFKVCCRCTYMYQPKLFLEIRSKLYLLELIFLPPQHKLVQFSYLLSVHLLEFLLLCSQHFILLTQLAKFVLMGRKNKCL